MEKQRNGKVVFFRESSDDDWSSKGFESISKAKAFNGLNSRTGTKAPANPVRETKAEAEPA